MKFYDVDSALQYAYGVDCWSHYGENILANWMDDTKQKWKPSSGMTRLDHIATAGKLTQLTRKTLNQHLLKVVDAFYIQPGQNGPYDADAHRTRSKLLCCEDLVHWCPVKSHSRYLMDQVRRWAGMDPLYTQKQWAQVVGVSTSTLASKNRELKRWLNDELSRAWLELELPFCEQGVIDDPASEPAL